MSTIFDVKEREVLDTPILLFQCSFTDGSVERWSTHRIVHDEHTYLARLVRHSGFELRAMSDDGVDGRASVTVILSDNDYRYSQIERTIGWKGSRLEVWFTFVDLETGEATTEKQLLFKGVGNSPEDVREGELRVSFTNRLHMQRILLPSVRIQRSCGWYFPSTASQRENAVGEHSEFSACGYSADILGGVGNLDTSGQPYTSCDYSKRSCQDRGLFDVDSQGRPTARFSGCGFVPASVLVRSFGDKSRHVSAVIDSEAKYNDPIPLVYGTAWISPPVIFAREDGNLMHMEVLVGVGPIQSVSRIIANGYEIPQGTAGRDMTGTGWYNLVSHGNRNGAFNLDFADSSGRPLGDPHGGVAFLSLVVPMRLINGGRLPTLSVLVEGLLLERMNEDGTPKDRTFTNNPAWVLLDVLRRSGWKADELDIESFAIAAENCHPSEEVELSKTIQSNLALIKQRSAAEIVRGLRKSSGLLLTYGQNGLLRALLEGSIAEQQPNKLPVTNATTPLMDGWPAYEFGDGTQSRSGILRRSSGGSTLRSWSKSNAEVPNRLVVEFQNALNEYQQDSVSVVDLQDIQAVGYESTATLAALGLPSMGQALRILTQELRKGIEGNQYIEFETSTRAFGLMPGHIITLTCLSEGFDRETFRILSLTLGTNYSTVKIVAQVHRDSWYDLSLNSNHGDADSTSGVFGGIPRPLPRLTAETISLYQTDETALELTDGSVGLQLTQQLPLPRKPTTDVLQRPRLSKSYELTPGGGLSGGRTLYYAIAAKGTGDSESEISSIVPVHLPDASSWTITLKGIHLPDKAQSYYLYRGDSPSELLRLGQERFTKNLCVDDGEPASTISPVDRAYDHVNIYWRLEHSPAMHCISATERSVKFETLRFTPNELASRCLVAVSPDGDRQELVINDNSMDEIFTTTPWKNVPTSSSDLIVVDAAWQFGAGSPTSPIVFQVPNRGGMGIQLLPVTANRVDQESDLGLAPLLRHKLTGGAGSAHDVSVPPKPWFSLIAEGNGYIRVEGISFDSVENTKSIHSGLVTMLVVDELSTEPPLLLQSDCDMTTESMLFDSSVAGLQDEFLLIGGEIVHLASVGLDGMAIVHRGEFETDPIPHEAGEAAIRLVKKFATFSFPAELVGSGIASSFQYEAYFPSVVVCAAELVVVNSRGASLPFRQNWCDWSSNGQRTLSGAQIAIQVGGYAASRVDAVPPTIVKNNSSIGRIYAIAGAASDSGPTQLFLRTQDHSLCELTIPTNETASEVVAGNGLGPLRSGDKISLDVLASGSTGGRPARDITVLMEL